MQIATAVLMGMAGFVLALISIVLLQEITSEETPVEIERESYCASYRWDNGRIVESCD